MKNGLTLVTLVTLVTLIMISSGCASPGRFSLLDLDLRTPEQIEAYQVEAQVPYEVKEIPNKEEIAPKAISVWSFLAPIIQVFKGRIKVLSFEWKGSQQKD